MNSNKKEFRINYGGNEVAIETGRLAKQANGAVLVSSGGTQVLVTVCSAYEIAEGQDFFPLMVDYREKFYAAGKFLGGFLKREGRPSTQETLVARLIDRPLRPLFPEGYFAETIIQATVLSYDPSADPEVLAGLGASACLVISDIPFNGPIGTCKVGRINGELILNPQYGQWKESDLELVVSASKDAILMVEGEANEISEQEMVEAIDFAHQHIKGICDLQVEMQKETGDTKREFDPSVPNEQMMERAKSLFKNDVVNCLSIVTKLDRQKAVRQLEDKVALEMKNQFKEFGLEEDDNFEKEAIGAVDSMLYEILRGDILNNEKRIDGRPLDKVRPIQTEIDILKRPHGSSLFTRGETQVMAAVTIGGTEGDQMSDRIVGLEYDKFYLHYTFPPFSVGEARGYRGVGRREMGHGNLAERALIKAIPNDKNFPYTIRVCCEVLESNGSSSMGSVCSGSLALMDAGIPINSPVAGIAMGLIYDMKGSNYKILTDILGDEDHLGDMDFKVAGTEKGITAIQMDIKIAGITRQIFEEALAQANEGRMHILGEMAKTISKPREELKEGAPRIETFKIAPDKIGALIGPAGKSIKALQEKFDVVIECEEDGTIKVIGNDTNKIHDCIQLAKLQIEGPTVGQDYEAKVVTIKEYGAFVDLAPGVSGLVHISEVTDSRVKDITEYVKEGDMIMIKVIEIDRMGRLKLSAKAVKPLEKKR